jgi:amicyanin
MERKLALFAIFAVSVFVAGVGALAYRGYAPGGSVAQVSIYDYSFNPSNLTIRAGTTVRWVNMDFVGHTVSFDSQGNETGIESPLLGHMGSFSHTFSLPGIYEYHCDPHPYMTGTVVAT